MVPGPNLREESSTGFRARSTATGLRQLRVVLEKHVFPGISAVDLWVLNVVENSPRTTVMPVMRHILHFLATFISSFFSPIRSKRLSPMHRLG